MLHVVNNKFIIHVGEWLNNSIETGIHPQSLKLVVVNEFEQFADNGYYYRSTRPAKHGTQQK